MKNKHNNADVLAKCSICGSGFKPGDFMVLEEQEKKTTFHATCGKCKTATMIFLSVTPGGIVSVGVATDLDRKEVRRMFKKEAVSVDEIIAMHEFIFEYRGNASGFIGEIKN